MSAFKDYVWKNSYIDERAFPGYVISKCFPFVHKPVCNFTDTFCDL